jgi:chemotaxis protein MotA
MVESYHDRAVSSRSEVTVELPTAGVRVDWALVIGLATAFTLVITALSMSGSVRSFYNLPSVMIVFIGTLAVTMMSFSLRETFGALGVVWRAVFPSHRAPQQAATVILSLASLARSRGILALDPVIDQLHPSPLLQRAIAMAVDGATAEEIETVMSHEIAAISERDNRNANVMRRAAEVAPAMGLIGTLVGLIQMLANLDDPTTIGPAMAIALLTTFYGAILAYMVFAPLASKLDRNGREDLIMANIHTLGAMSIARQEHPRRLETMLNTILSPSDRIDYFD